MFYLNLIHIYNEISCKKKFFNFNFINILSLAPRKLWQVLHNISLFINKKLRAYNTQVSCSDLQECQHILSALVIEIKNFLLFYLSCSWLSHLYSFCSVFSLQAKCNLSFPTPLQNFYLKLFHKLPWHHILPQLSIFIIQ